MRAVSFFGIVGLFAGVTVTPLGAETTSFVPCLSSLPSGTSIAISEIRTNSPADQDEYCEICAAANQSLLGLTYLVIGDGPGGCGVIENATPLGALSTQADGLIAVGNVLRPTPILTYDIELPLNFENDDGVTHMLVSGFFGNVGDDLDADNDGDLDPGPPWVTLVDCVALHGGSVPDCIDEEFLYCDDVVGAPEGLQSAKAPCHVFKCDYGWVAGDHDIVGLDTPGAPNPCGPIPVERASWGRLKSRYR